MSEPADRRSAEEGQDLETREVRVDDPELSPETNERLTEQLRSAVGRESVRVPRDRPHASQGEHPATDPAHAGVSSNQLSLMIGLVVVVVLAGIGATAISGSFWFVGVAILLDLVGLASIAFTAIKMMRVTERPDPTIAAAMEAEGVTNPDERFTEMVEEFQKEDAADGEHRDTSVQENPVTAGKEQKSAATPTSGPSRAVGPG